MEQYILVFRKAERMLCSEACEQANAKVASYDDLNFLARNYSQFLAEEVSAYDLQSIDYKLYSVRNTTTRRLASKREEFWGLWRLCDRSQQ